MLDKEKNVKKIEDESKTKLTAKEINIDELDSITGGSLANVRYTETTPISEATKNKI